MVYSLDEMDTELPADRRSGRHLKMFSLTQFHPLQTRTPVLADDDVVVHGVAGRGGDIDDGRGHPDLDDGNRPVTG